MTLQHAKDDHFPGCASTAFTFADSTEIALVNFDITLKYFMCFFGKIKGNNLTNFSIEKSC